MAGASGQIPFTSESRVTVFSAHEFLWVADVILLPATVPTTRTVLLMPSASPILSTKESRPAAESVKVPNGTAPCPSELRVLGESARMFNCGKTALPYLALRVSESVNGSLQLATGMPTLLSAVLDDGLV